MQQQYFTTKTHTINTDWFWT